MTPTATSRGSITPVAFGRRLLVVVVAFAAIAAGVSATATATVSQSSIRVRLMAKNHDPRPSERPNWQWWYCVTIRTVLGQPVPASIQLRVQILSGRTPVEGVEQVSFKKGYPKHAWCGAIGGEANVLYAAPRGKKLVLQAVVRAKGKTIERNWPIVVR